MTNFNWYFTREEIDNKSPSREDGVTLSTEIRYRREGARLIINASNTLGLYPSNPILWCLCVCIDVMLCVFVSLTTEQSLRDHSHRCGVLSPLLHDPELPTVQSLGGGLCVPPPRGEGGGDTKEVSRHHQSLPVSVD